MPEPAPEAWAQIRNDYEQTDKPLAHICAEHDVTVPTVRYRMKVWAWKRRKPLIPRQGPPAVAVELAASFAQTTPTPTLPLAGGGSSGLAPQPTPPAPGDGEAASIGPRLQSAVARVLPAIEAIIARLACGAQHPREMEQAGRTFSSLTRTLRELNALLAEARAAGQCDDDADLPKDIDAFRIDLARRLEGLVAAEREREANEQKDQK